MEQLCELGASLLELTQQLSEIIFRQSLESQQHSVFLLHPEDLSQHHLEIRKRRSVFQKLRRDLLGRLSVFLGSLSVLSEPTEEIQVMHRDFSQQRPDLEKMLWELTQRQKEE